MAKAGVWKSVNSGLGCGVSLKRVLPFFAVNLVLLAAIATFFDSAAALLNAAGNPISAVIALLPGIVSVGVVFIVMFFVSLFLQAGLADNARNYWNNKEVKFGKSLGFARPAYPSLVGATLLVLLISIVLNFIPIIGWLLSIIVSWLFLFLTPAVVLSKKSATDALEDSYRIFMKAKWQTFVFWLAITVLSAILSVLSLIPVFLTAVPAMASAPGIGFIAAFRENFYLFIVGGIFSAFFLAYVTVFTESAKTFYYLQAKGKKK